MAARFQRSSGSSLRPWALALSLAAAGALLAPPAAPAHLSYMGASIVDGSLTDDEWPAVRRSGPGQEAAQQQQGAAAGPPPPPLPVQLWPATHPAEPPVSRLVSYKRYLPYHPVARFRGLGIEARPFLQMLIQPEDLGRPKKKLSVPQLLMLLNQLSSEGAQAAGARSQRVRFGFSRRRRVQQQ
ncbi:uncharacterized protein LOC126281970 [Schistocerca gregaria]|uniref:uncharacterized protein LOC126281970 n=1 Tax=Schistocerca gregaria TaxID=7010 RepID=UPI00211DC5B2|nr:uncharacterized protein LOC126281970 [Schistocerca gregaria]